MDEDDDRDYDILPVVDFKDDLVNSIRDNQIIICIGETGSGKTTQIPQFCVDTGLNNDKCVAVTQPRRVAAITVAQRVAEERNSALGDETGYVIRFDDSTSSKTKIRFMTDGILVRECLSDPMLTRYQIIMLDEAHERSINTDILFGLMKRACHHRPDLRLIVTSATLDVDKFRHYFDNCPLVRVPGRVFPVDIYHSKTKQVMTTSGPASNSYVKSAAEVVMRIHEEEDEGHILVFLTGQEEIEKCCAMIRDGLEEKEGKQKNPSLLVIPMYAALATDAQRLVFKKVPDGVRKVVVATNIAETSVTVPHVRYVVDTGYVKQKVYDPTRHMQSLVVVPISQVSAEQRAGRAGRTASGKCYRLYSSDCLSAMSRETVPEIQRTNLSNVILQLKALGIHDVMGFDYIDPPSSDLIAEGLLNLHMLGGLDDTGALTSVGRSMTAFSVEPVLSRIIIRSADSDTQCLDEAITVAAMLSVEDFWVKKQRKTRDGSDHRDGMGSSRRHNNDDSLDCDEAHAALAHPLGDYHTYLHIFRSWESSGASQDWCFDRFLRYRSLRMASQIRSQLWDESVSAGLADRSLKPKTLSVDSMRGSHKDVHTNDKKVNKERDVRLTRAAVVGLFMNVARKCTNESIFRTVPLTESQSSSKSVGYSYRDFIDTDVRLLHLHPSCALLSGGKTGAADLVMYQEIVVGAKPSIRHVVVADAVSSEVSRLRSGWSFVLPCVLSGRDPPPEPAAEHTDSGAAASTKRKFEGSSSVSQSNAGGGGHDRESTLSSAKERYAARKKHR